MQNNRATEFPVADDGVSSIYPLIVGATQPESTHFGFCSLKAETPSLFDRPRSIIACDRSSELSRSGTVGAKHMPIPE